MSLILLTLVSLIALVAVFVALPFLLIVALWRTAVRLWRGRQLVSNEWSRPETLKSSSPLVVAVHGTWAQEGKAVWTIPGSDLHTAVTKAIRDATGETPGWYVF